MADKNERSNLPESILTEQTKKYMASYEDNN